MGAWGYKNFENDAAADFVWDVFESESGVLKVIDTIKNFADNVPGEEMAEETLAAIEFIAAAKGNPSSDITVEAEKFVSDKLLHFKQYLVPGFRDENLNIIDKSVEVINRIREDSELNDLWKESDDYNNWLETLSDLETRVKS